MSKVHIGEMYNVYRCTRKNKRRSDDSIEFEIVFEKNLMKLIHNINHRIFDKDGNYTFIATEPTRNGCREVFAAELSKRIIHHYVDIYFRELLESELTNCTFNNRKDMGVLKAVEAIRKHIDEESRHYTEECYIIKWDLKAFFMCIIHKIIDEKIQDLIDRKYVENNKDILKWLIHECIYEQPQKNCYRKSPNWKWDTIETHKSLYSQPSGQGAAIGFLIWQMFINYYHNDIDKWLSEELGFRFVRFVDDMLIITKDKDFVLKTVIPELRRRYALLNITIQEKKFYCQSFSKGVKFCGMTIKFDRIYPNSRVIHNFRYKIARFNRAKNKRKHMFDFVNMFNSYIGIMKYQNAYNVMMSCLHDINDEWWKLLQWNEDRLILEPKPHFDFVHSLEVAYGIEIYDINSNITINGNKKRIKKKKYYNTNSQQFENYHIKRLH